MQRIPTLKCSLPKGEGKNAFLSFGWNERMHYPLQSRLSYAEGIKYGSWYLNLYFSRAERKTTIGSALCLLFGAKTDHFVKLQ